MVYFTAILATYDHPGSEIISAGNCGALPPAIPAGPSIQASVY
jgi:hypothetical protein